MSDTLILQIAEGHLFRKCHSLYWPHLQKYCEEWDVDYWLHCGPIWPWSYNPDVPNLSPWGKYELIAGAFRQGYKNVAYLDVDSFICNPKIDIRWAFQTAFNAVEWWVDQPTRHFQAGDMFFKNDPANGYPGLAFVQFLMREAKYFLQRYPSLRGWFDQGQILEAYLMEDWRKHYTALDVRWNWCPDYCPPCENPVIRSFHSYASIGKDLYEEMKKEIEKYYGKSSLEV